jgi:hypothetical protein
MIGPADPRAFGVNRRSPPAVSAAAREITKLDARSPWLFSALAMADRRVLATTRADLRGTC